MRNFLLAAAMVASMSLDDPAWFHRELPPVTGADGAATMNGAFVTSGIRAHRSALK